jgi:hypothetical protein
MVSRRVVKAQVMAAIPCLILEITDAIKKNIETLIDAGKVICLEVNVEKTKQRYTWLPRRDAGQNRDVKIANRSFDNVAYLKYLVKSVTNQNLIQEEIYRRLNSSSACYHSVQNLLSCRVLSRNLKIRMIENIILSVVLYGYETWSLTLREEHGLRVFENRVMRRIF